MSKNTAVCICNSLVHSPLSSLHNMAQQKVAVILCCVFLLSAAVPIREEASGATSIVQDECEKDGEVYETGAQTNNTEVPCQLCYCQKGKLVCAVIQCYHRDDCEPHFVPGRCCPKYDHCPALGEKKDEILLPLTKKLEDDINEFALGDDPSAYFAGHSASNSAEEHNSAEALGADIKSESVIQSKEEQPLDLSKVLINIPVESSTAKLEHDGGNIGESNVFEMQHMEKILGGKVGNDSKSTEDTIAEIDEKLDYQNEEAEEENIQHNTEEPNLSEILQKEKGLDSKDGNDRVHTEEMGVRSIVKIGYQDEEHEEENRQNVEETRSSEHTESLQSNQENDESSDVANGERKLHEAQQDVLKNIGEQDSGEHPYKGYKEQLISSDNNHDESTVIQPDYQDDENQQHNSQPNVGEPDASQNDENKKNEQEYYDVTTYIITTQRNEQDKSGEESDLFIGKQYSSELNVKEESLQDENYEHRATEEVITEINLNHQNEEEHKQENEQPIGEQASFESKLDEDENNYTTEIMPTESNVNANHQNEHILENNQHAVEQLHSSATALDEESLQSKEEYDRATEVMPVKKNVNLNYQDRHDEPKNIGEPYPSEKHYSKEEIHDEDVTEAAITERNMNLGSYSAENQAEKKQQENGELHQFETHESNSQEESKERMGDALEISESIRIEKNKITGTNTLITVSNDATALPYIAKQVETHGETMENDYTVYRSEFVEGPRGAHYLMINNAKKLNNMEHEVHKEATDNIDKPPKFNDNITNENTSRETESNDWLKLPYSEEGSGSNRFDDCAGGKEECAFLVKEWKILLPQLAMAPTPSPFNFWEYYDYSSSEVRPVSYNDPEEVLILLPHPHQNDQNVVESLENTVEFAMQHKTQDTNAIF